MRTELFDYHLPEDRIAQEPMSPRDHSRLLILQRKTGEIQHRYFFDIIDQLNAGDLLIANESSKRTQNKQTWTCKRMKYQYQ